MLPVSLPLSLPLSCSAVVSLSLTPSLAAVFMMQLLHLLHLRDLLAEMQKKNLLDKAQRRSVIEL